MDGGWMGEGMDGDESWEVGVDKWVVNDGR